MNENDRKIAILMQLHDIHKRWQPHPGQLDIILPIILERVKDVFVQAGRSFGKTESISYLLWRYAIEHPGSENYYFAPYMKQAREILWASGRIQWFGPKECIKGTPNSTEMRIILKNGSFIKLDGSDNVEAYRGVKPKGLSVYDEFKDFKPEFHEAYDPNRAAHDSPLLIIGTPPDRECQFTRMAADFEKNPAKRFFQMSSSKNPHLDPAWLESKKTELVARGESDVWEREYEALFVKGGQSKLFPMLYREKCVWPHDRVLAEIRRYRKKMDFILWADPAAASVFAVLHCAYHPFQKVLYCVDEIYETSQAEMTVKRIAPRIFEKRDEIEDDEQWRQGYDEAEKWFQSQVLDDYAEHFEPSHKYANDKEQGLTLIKDMLLEGKLIMSDRCEKLFWEMDNYFKDKHGKIPKVNDHLIDCLRYILAALGYMLNTQQEPEKTIDDELLYKVERLQA